MAPPALQSAHGSRVMQALGSERHPRTASSIESPPWRWADPGSRRMMALELRPFANAQARSHGAHMSNGRGPQAISQGALVSCPDLMVSDLKHALRGRVVVPSEIARSRGASGVIDPAVAWATVTSKPARSASSMGAI